MGAILELSNVSVRRGERVILGPVDWRVEEGQRWVVLGPNGAGKTTLLQVCSSLIHPTAGEIKILEQTLGLDRTGAAITGFVTGLYVVLTPLIAWLVLKQKVNRFTWICIAIATVGLGLLSIRGFTVGIGELLVFMSAICFACHIISLSKWSLGRDVYAMTVVQLFMCAALAGIASIPEGYSPPPDAGVWGVVIFTAVFATVIAFIIQTWAQAHMSPTKVAVILTMEVVFAAFFAIIFGGERLTLQSVRRLIRIDCMN